MQQLKSEGRLRFMGISNHGTNWFKDPEETMDRVLIAAALDGRFDVMLLAYNFIQDDKGAEVLKVCREKNIGTTLMKVNPIGKIPMMKERIEKLKKEGKEVPENFPTMITRMEAKAKTAEAFIKEYRLDDAQRMRRCGYPVSYCPTRMSIQYAVRFAVSMTWTLIFPFQVRSWRIWKK